MNRFTSLGPWRYGGLALLTLGMTVALGSPLMPWGQTSAQLGRWLEVRRFSGGVTVQTDRSRNAWVGARLTQSGHGITTGARATSTLVADLNIGSVTLAQNTRMTVQRLDVLSNGGRVTILRVHRGQARMQARPMNNPSSRLELHTPSGIASVRGTDFGVAVEETGDTNVGTLDGRVEAIAQGEIVSVDPGLVSVIHPGEAPSPPFALDRVLDLTVINQNRRGTFIYLVGRIDPGNTLLQETAEDLVELPTDRGGYFEVTIPFDEASNAATLVVRNVMGESRRHELTFSRIPQR
ncbi:MAG: FecR family protein [Leptolyngbya sp.]|nr:FecR family protein [Leptolyngbya sp.]